MLLETLHLTPKAQNQQTSGEKNVTLGVREVLLQKATMQESYIHPLSKYAFSWTGEWVEGLSFNLKISSKNVALETKVVRRAK